MFENEICYFAKHVYYRKFFMSLAQQLAVRWCMYLLNVSIYILQQLYNCTSLCCMCTVTSVFCEREQNQLLAWCIIADNIALRLNALFLTRVVNRSTCDPYFKTTLSSEWQFCASSAATWPIVELLPYSQTLGLSSLKRSQLLQTLREGKGFSWHRHEAAVPIVHVVNSGWQGLFAR